MKKISVIIPVYNEEKYIEETIKDVVKSKIGMFCKEIIVINDGSRDRTMQILRKCKQSYTDSRNIIKIISKKNNQGKGAALRDGMRQATGDIIITQDADLEYDPKEYDILLKPFNDKKTNVVYGSRTLGRIKYHNSYSGLFFFIGGQILTHFMNILYGTSLTDQPTGYKLFRRSLIPLLVEGSEENGFAYEVAMTALMCKNNNKIKEIPITYKPRHIKEGKKININDFIRSMYVGIKYKFN